MGVSTFVTGAMDNYLNPLRDSVDVVIPVYNGSKTIVAAIDSVLAQDYGSIKRIIIVDDGSLDNTSELIRILDIPGLQLIQIPNGGVSAARNLGIQHAKSEWIAFLDADDRWASEKTRLQLAAAQRHEVDFICSLADGATFTANKIFTAWDLWRGNVVVTSSVLVRRTALARYGPTFDADISFGEDYLMWLKLLTFSKGYIFGVGLVSYTLSQRPNYKFMQVIRNLAKLLGRYYTYVWTEKRTWRHQFLPLIISIGMLISIGSIAKRFITSAR